MPIGIQYEWLAGFCQAHELEQVELCVQGQNDREHEVGALGLMRPYLLFQEDKYGERYARIDPRHKEHDIAVIFGRLRFPLLEATKKQIETRTLEHGLEELMKLTWFCHRPTRRNRPCGTCSPCTQVMTENMRYRMPWLSQLRYHLHRLKRSTSKMY